MTTIIKAHDAADFLALVPHLAGYTPKDSLVLVPFRGSRTAGILRFDLPHPQRDRDVFAATAIGTVCRIPDVDGIAILVYGADPDGPHGHAHASLVAGLRVCAEACGVYTGEALWIGGSRWGSFVDPGVGGATADILPMATPDLPRPRADQSAGVRLPRARPAARRAIADALVAIDDAVIAVRGADHGIRGGVAGVDPRALAALELLDDVGSLWERAVTEAPADDDAGVFISAALLWALSRPILRDAGLASWCHGPEAGERALAANLRWAEGESMQDEGWFLAGVGPRPDAGRLTLALDRVRRLAAVADGEHRVAALASAAWLAWALGGGTHADAYARQALRIDPEHGLSGIVLRFAQIGRLPDWAFERHEDGA